MILVYSTSFKEIKVIKEYLNITYGDEYELLSNKDELYEKLMFETYSIILFDYEGDIDLIDTLLMMKEQLESIKVIASNVDIGRMYLTLTENIQIQPNALNIMIYLWDNPAFSLGNVISAQENNVEVFTTKLKPIDYGDSFITIKTTIDEQNDIDLISIEFSNLYDFSSFEEEPLEEEEESLEEPIEEEPKINIFTSIKDTIKTGVNILKSDMDMSEPNNVFVEPNGEDNFRREIPTLTEPIVQEEHSEPSSLTEPIVQEEPIPQEEYSEPSSLTEQVIPQEELITQEQIYLTEPVPQEQLIPQEEYSEPVQEESVTLTEPVQELILQEQVPLTEPIPQEPIQEEPVSLTEPIPKDKNKKQKKSFNIRDLFGKKNKNKNTEVEENEEVPNQRKLSTLRRKKLVIYRTEIEYFTNECSNVEDIKQVYNEYMVSINSGEKMKLSEVLYDRGIISDEEYIKFTKDFLKRSIFSYDEIMQYNVILTDYNIDNYNKLRFIELETFDNSKLFVVSVKALNTINTLNKRYENCRIVLTLDKYITARLSQL